MRRFFVKISLALLLGLSLFVCQSLPAHAQYPTAPINIICPFGAGGAGDLSARILANAAKDLLPKPVVVVNKPGAAGVVGTTIAFQSKADGYTLLMGRIANSAIIPALNKTIKYKWDDFVFLGMLDLNPLVFVVHKDSPYKTLQELADAIKAKPNTLSFSTAGALNVQEITAYMLLHAMSMNKNGAISVPFQSDAAGKNAILGQHVNFGALNLAAVFDQLQEGGGLRALAVTTAQRLEDYPQIPTVREAGFPELENMLGWNALYGIKGMPEEAVRQWTSILQALKTDEAWRKNTRNTGSIPYIQSPEDTQKFVQDQVVKFEKLGVDMNLTIR